jgi:predicted TIM-barrel fold metal-dependent hydrolase
MLWSSGTWGGHVDIVDAQLHIGRGGIEATLAAMDAIGIRSVLLDEFWGTRNSPDPTHIDPGFELRNGAWRAISPTAEEGSLLFPDRFSYLVRIDRWDPDLESVLHLAASSPYVRAVRLQPVWTAEEARAFADGAYDAVFELAERAALPVCLFIPGYVELLPPYLLSHPKLWFVVDHCGMGFGTFPVHRGEEDLRRTSQVAYFDEVLKLAEHPNAALKWSHVQDRFGVQDYPYLELWPLLRRAIDAFGASRIIWASDSSVIPNQSWSDLLYWIRDHPEISDDERAWILAGAARRIFGWPTTE